MAESAIKRTLSDTERRARIFTVVSTGPAQNGTSGVLADGMHARRRATWGHAANRCSGAGGHRSAKLLASH